MIHQYAIQLLPLPDSDGGGWLGVVRDLPGCMGDGETPEEALADVHAAMKEWMSEAHRLGREIPAPRPDDVASILGEAVEAA